MWSIDLGLACQVSSIGKRQYFQQILLEQWDYHIQKCEEQTLPHIYSKVNSKYIIDLNITQKYK